VRLATESWIAALLSAPLTSGFMRTPDRRINASAG